MQIERMRIKDLNPAEYNPRKDLQPDDPEYKKIERSIEHFGYVDPIIWNKQTGNIVGGHQRLKVLIDKGYNEVDVSVVDLSIEDEKALNVALNKITGEWDNDKLTELLVDLEHLDFDMELTGFSLRELESLLNVDDDIQIQNNIQESVNFIIKCENLTELEVLKSILNISTDKIIFQDFSAIIKRLRGQSDE